jgi:DNA polymerase I-like protein with 3'-5' exonuclease and polymerase domains
VTQTTIDITKLDGFDLETSGLQPWNGEIYTMAHYHTEGVTLREPSAEQLGAWLDNCKETGLTIVGWNVMFDIAWLIAKGLGDKVRQNKWLDAMLLLKRIDGFRHSYGLKTVVKEKWPQHADYAIDDFSKPETPEAWQTMLVYNLKDVIFTITLAKEYIGQMTDKELTMALIEAECLPELAQAWVDGIYIDEAALAKLREENTAELVQLRLDLGVSPKVVASPKQLAQLLYNEWGLPVLDRTEKGAPSTSKDALHKLAIYAPQDDRIKNLLRMRKCKTTEGKYIEAVEKSIALHGRNITHPQPQAGGTYTSRLTYSSKQGKGKDELQTGIALHQWSRDKRVRAELIPPPGYLLGEWDFSGQEMRLMADASQDETMLSLFLDNIDGHAFMGASIKSRDWKWVHEEQDNDPEAKQIRLLGKFANLSLQYRIGVATIRIRALTQYGLNLSEADATLIRNKYALTYPGVLQYWVDSIKKAAERGYAETRGGHRIKLDDMSEYSNQQTAINFPIQGTGGDMKLLALSVLKNHFAELGVHFAWDLHDALFLYVPDDSRAVKTANFIQHTLSNLPYEKAWGWKPAVPLPVDGKLGKSWGSLKSYKEQL